MGWASGETHQSPSPGGVVAAAAEPTVVEHEALDTDGGGALGETTERVEIVIEIHRLPRVQHHRPRTIPVGRRRAHDGVELPARHAEPARRVNRVHHWRCVALAGSQHDLAGMQQLAQLDHRPTVRQAHRMDPRIAAPCQVSAPHLAGLLAEAGGAGPQHRRVLVRRTAAAILGEQRPVVDRPPSRMELPAPPPVEGDQLGDVRRHGQGDRQVVDPVVVVAIVDELDRDAHRTTQVATCAGDEAEGGDLVGGFDRDALVVGDCRYDIEPWCPSTPVGPVPAEPRSPGEPGAVLGHQGQRRDDVEPPNDRRHHQRGAGRRQRAAVADRRAPVDEHAAAHGWVDDEAGVVTAQIDERAGGHQPLVAPRVSPLMKCFCRAR